jgi:Flp pilus assembly protein TadD
MILEVQYVLWDLRPWGYHLTSLVLYALDTVVLYALTLALLVRCRPGCERAELGAPALGAALAVALFAIHPLRTEVVAWASCQPYLSCALFSMLAILAYLRASGEPPSQSPRRGWLAGAFILFAAALLSKVVAVSLPAVLLILDVYPLRRLGSGPGRWCGPTVRKVWWEKVPFGALSLVFMVLAIAGRVHDRHLVPLKNQGFTARIAQACYGIWFYLIKTVLPSGITAFYPLPERVEWYEPLFLLSILGTLGVSAGLFFLRRRWPGLLAAWLSYVVILAPNLGLVRIGKQIAADRYSYMAMLGGVMLVAAGLSRFFSRAMRHARAFAVGSVAAGLGLILGLIILTRAQCRTWRTSETLWTHALEYGAERSDLVHNNLGVVLARQGRIEEAMAQYAEALRLNPDHAKVHNNLGAVLIKQGKLGEALSELAVAVRLDPGNAEAHNNLGAVLVKQGRVEEAMAHYTEALRHDPDDAEVYNNRAMIWAAYPEARYRDGRRAVEAAACACELTGWKDSRILDTLAAAYAEAGEFEAAVKWQTTALDLVTDTREREDFRTRLELYRKRQPYREPGVEGR